MKIVKEFSRFAEEYNQRNIIQLEVAKRLVSMLPKKKYKHVLDIGSGSGAVCSFMIKNQILFEKFVAFDFSEEMLKLHPKDEKIFPICLNFNNKNAFTSYVDNEFDILLSSSALQWSEDLSSVLQSISRLADEQYFTFFTSNTFSTLHKIAGIVSPIYSKKIIEQSLKDYFDYTVEVVEYKLYFDSVQEMFRYIKRSGVSGGAGKLTYREMKQLMKNYPLNYLEFEVLFIKAVTKNI